MRGEFDYPIRAGLLARSRRKISATPPITPLLHCHRSNLHSVFAKEKAFS